MHKQSIGYNENPFLGNFRIEKTIVIRLAKGMIVNEIAAAPNELQLPVVMSSTNNTQIKRNIKIWKNTKMVNPKYFNSACLLVKSDTKQIKNIRHKKQNENNQNLYPPP